MIDEHAEAVLTLLRAEFARFYDADEVPANPEYPYGVVFTDSGPLPPRRLAGSSRARGWRTLVQGYGTTAYGARFILSKASEALENKRPIVAGRNCTLVAFESSGPPVARDQDRFDDDGNAIYTGSSVWIFGSAPAAA